MRLSVEVLDHIFSFLVSHLESLDACSKEPVLFPIVARHLYHHVTIRISEKPKSTRSEFAFEPERISKLVSENPYISNYVRVLKIEPDFAFPRIKYRQVILRRLDEFANTLLMFPLLERVILSSKVDVWYWSDGFRAALENRLNLPTIKEVHFVGGREFPFSLLENCKHVKNLSLSGSFKRFKAEGRFCDPPLPQLESLALLTDYISSLLLAWLKLCIEGLQSLKYRFSAVEVLPDFLGVCSESLKKLEIDLTSAGYTDYTDHISQRGQIDTDSLVELSPVPPNLHRLTLRTAVHRCHDIGHPPNCCLSNLPAAAEIIRQFISSPRSLILDIDIDFSTCSDLTLIDFSSLTVLGAASVSIPRINLYVHARFNVTHTHLMPLIEEHEDIARAIKTGVLFIHPGKTVCDA